MASLTPTTKNPIRAIIKDYPPIYMIQVPIAVNIPAKYINKSNLHINGLIDNGDNIKYVR